MPLWFPVIAAGAAIALATKALARHFNGQLSHSAVVDPDGVRTVARFTVMGDPVQVLQAIAGELAGLVEEPLEVTADAIRGDSARGRVDIVRLVVCRPGEQVPLRYTLTLTRAWTGAQLDGRAIELLGKLHDALTHAGVGELAWHPRQDREWRDAHAHPYY